MSIIKVSHIYKTFDNTDNTVEAIKNISFEIKKGEIYGIIGLSGAGKSTLIRCLNLLEKPDKGSVIVDGDDLLKLSEKSLREKRKKIGMIFQSFNLLMQTTVLENVCFPMTISGVSKTEARKKALDYLDIVGIKDKANSYPSQLSGGQKQRVAIARVLASDPEILLCDEATSALDPETTKSILALLKDINEKYGITIVVITHQMSVIQEICQRCAVLENGKLMEENTVEELFKHPKTDAAKRLIFSNNSGVASSVNGKIVRIVFEDSNATEPVVGNLILEFNTPVNILESNLTNIGNKTRGQMIIQLPNDEKVAKKMIGYLNKKKFISVEEVSSYE